MLRTRGAGRPRWPTLHDVVDLLKGVLPVVGFPAERIEHQADLLELLDRACGLIAELAEFENLTHLMKATEADLRESLFGPDPGAEALLLFPKGASAPVAFALFFHNYSTFLAKPGIYLEDLFVDIEHRGRGIGKALLVRLAQVAVERTETAETVRLRTHGWVLTAKKLSHGIDDIKLVDAAESRVLFPAANQPTNSEWLPGPADRPLSWAFADSPRCVPPTWGPKPAPASNTNFVETSGWDLTNDSPDVYVFLPNGDYRTLRRDFLDVTGHSELPPLYAFGYIHSRYHRDRKSVV